MAEMGATTTVLVNGQEVSVPANFFDLPADQQNLIVDRTAQARGISKAPAYSSSVLPISTDQQGNISPSWGLLGTVARSARDAFMLPGDVASGAQPVLDPITGRTNPSLIDRSINLATTINPVSPANIAGRPSLLPAPTAAQLQQTGGAGFDAARATGMELYGPSIGNWATGVKDQLAKESRIPATAEQTYAHLDTFPPGYNKPVGLADFQAIRSRLMDIATGVDRKDAAAAAIAIKRLDDHLANLTPANTLGGTMPAGDVSDILQTARGNYAAGQRGSAISGDLEKGTQGIVKQAEANIGASGSSNLDTALRQRVNAFLKDDSNLLGFTKDEISMLEAVRDGTATQNTLRRLSTTGALGRLAAGQVGGAAGFLGGGLLGLDPATATAAGAVVPAAGGALSKMLENILARRSISAADEAIRQRSPMYKARAAMQQPALELTARDRAVMQALMPGLLAPPPAPGTLTSDRQMPPGFI